MVPRSGTAHLFSSVLLLSRSDDICCGPNQMDTAMLQMGSVSLGLRLTASYCLLCTIIKLKVEGECEREGAKQGEAK